jgi:hypothetical protein
MPALDVPFWGDDYSFLLNAHAANVSHEPWWSAYWPENPLQFWRPLSQESWWRFVELALDADARYAHLANLSLLLIAAAGVGLLAFSISRICEWPQAGQISVLSGALYGSLALHLLPVHWAAAANSSILVVFITLILAAWISASGAGPRARVLYLACIPLLLVAALLSKESAVLTPALMLVLSLFVGKGVRGRAEVLTWFACCVLVICWLLLRARFTVAADPNYELVLGTNVLRNGLSLVAWLLNVPREALRLFVLDETWLGLAWSMAVALPMIAVWVMATCRSGPGPFDRRQACAIAAFCVLAYAPYVFLAWNSYAYYAAVAALLPTIVLARGLVRSRVSVVAAALVGLSSWLAVAGTRSLEDPGLIGRARWAEATLQSLERAQPHSPLWVTVEDPQRFHALGVAGLSWRLDLDPRSVHQVEACPEAMGDCLAIEADGRVSMQGQLQVSGKP